MTKPDENEQDLPWLTNGGLSEPDAARMRETVDSDPAPQEEETFLKSLRQGLRDNPEPAPSTETGLQRTMQQLRFERRTRNQSSGWRWMAVAACLLLTVQAAFWLSRSEKQASVFPRVSPGNHAVIQVQFRPDASIAEINGFLAKTGATIISGPADQGIYTVRLDKLAGKSHMQWVQELRQNPMFIFVQEESPNNAVGGAP